MEFKSISWDDYFRNQLAGIALKSKDPSRKVGAIAVREEQVIMTGFNGFPRGVDDKISSRYEKGRKNLYTLHAEGNIVSLSSRNGISLKGATVYCNLHPCYACANLMINAGIKRVVCPPAVIEPVGEELYFFDVAIEVMLEAGIEIESDGKVK
jgi:dCMP deaminase